MLWLLIWLVYGLVVGFIGKLLYIGNDPKGIPSTIVVGIAGSYMGGLINYLVGTADAISYTGALMGIIGAVICCWIYDKFRLNRIMEMQKFQMAELEEEARTLRMRMSDWKESKQK